jgi:pre-mRNA-splicing factor CWC22
LRLPPPDPRRRGDSPSAYSESGHRERDSRYPRRDSPVRRYRPVNESPPYGREPRQSSPRNRPRDVSPPYRRSRDESPAYRIREEPSRYRPRDESPRPRPRDDPPRGRRGNESGPVRSWLIR